MKPTDFPIQFDDVHKQPTNNTFLKLCRKIRADFKFKTHADYITFKRLIFKNSKRYV